MAVRTILMTDAQIRLLARAIRSAPLDAAHGFSPDEVEELGLLAGCADDTVAQPPDGVHGWCL